MKGEVKSISKTLGDTNLPKCRYGDNVPSIPVKRVRPGVTIPETPEQS